MKNILLAATILFSFSADRLWAYWARVAVPVADVRSVSATLPNSYDYDPNQETQLLYGEPVKVLQVVSDWAKIEAVDQDEFSHKNKWEGYPGWVKKSALARADKILPPNCVVRQKVSHLYSKPDPKSLLFPVSLGTQLVALEETQNGFRKVKTVKATSAWVPESEIRPIIPGLNAEKSRKIILDSASQLLGDPYFWGGLSAKMDELPQQVTAVDCSGLVHLSYRVAGIRVPRDSLEQYMKARKIKPSELKPGDLIFSASKEKPEKVSHVTLYLGEGRIIEAPKSGETVRKIEFENKYGIKLEQVRENEPVGDRLIYFGTYFSPN